VAKLAEDVCMFLKDVGRQVVDEKLKSVRRMLQSLESGGMDPDIAAAFGASVKGPFGGRNHYDDEEIANFLRTDLQRLEEQCVSVINRCNAPIPGAMNLYDAHVSWPHVERLEPWVRMAEYWTSSSDTSFAELEMSTAHYEFRKYFRVVVVKLPFQSTEFEQRMYSIRHWLHRQTSCEFHTTHRRNLVYDGSVFPTEHDPSIPTTNQYHRMFSFALDWQSAPVGLLSVECARKGDNWNSVALRLGCTVEDLKECNEGLVDVSEGVTLNVPGAASRRLSSFGAAPRVLALAGDGGQRIKTWAEAASIVGCTVEELQQANGEAALSYKVGGNGGGEFDSAVEKLQIPHTAWVAASEEEFASTEAVYLNDTFESVAARIECSVQELRDANPDLENISSVTSLQVPLTAKAPRRLVNPQLRKQAATDALLARTVGEEQSLSITNIPHLPENSARFPHEYHTASSRFPTTPQDTSIDDNWMAYTAKFLDTQFKFKGEPTPVYNVNKLWPMQQVPGRVDQTPFEEDQTWFMHPIPVQQMEQHHPEKDMQDLPFVNHEQFPRSVEWTAP